MDKFSLAQVGFNLVFLVNIFYLHRKLVPRIPGGAISLRDLMELKAGLVVRLDQRDEDPIEILTNGEPSLRGRLIRAGSATAIEIAGWAEEESADEESQ